MGRIRARYFRCIDNSLFDLSGCKFLGQGSSGMVYHMPDGRVIKIFKSEESCIHECIILESVRGNKHFPKVFECRGNYMIREFVDGICIKDYIREHGLSRTLALNLINLIEDFKKLGFTRLDMRCAHIFVQEDESLKVIDPRKHYTQYTPYPKNMLNSLRRLNALATFMKVLKEERPSLYNAWKKAV